jgi:small subunit ribosomal protein S18
MARNYGKKRRKLSFLTEHRITFVDFKDDRLLRRFVNDRGKIVPRRVTGLTAKQQRMVTTAIKRARLMAILPFEGEAMR